MADFDFLSEILVGDDGLAGSLFDFGAGLTVAIATPTISPVAGDDNINALDAAGPIYIAGRASPDVTIALVWGSLQKTGRSEATGSWVFTIMPSEIPPDGLVPVSVIAIDAAGNRSEQASRAVTIARTIELRPPVPVLYHMQTGPSPRLIYGSARPGAIVHVRIDFGNRMIVQADQYGEWRQYFETAPGMYTVDVRQELNGYQSEWSESKILAVVHDVTFGDSGDMKMTSTADRQRVKREMDVRQESMPSAPTISAPFRTPKAWPISARTGK